MLPDRFDPRYYEPEVLFRYHAGWAGLSFSRASSATLTDRTGTLREAAANVPRIEWLDLDGDGVRETPTVLLERAATNMLLDSCNLPASGSAWGSTSNFAVSASTSIFAGQTAWRHQNLGLTGSAGRSQSIGTFTGQPETASAIVENVNATETALNIRDNTASVNICIGRLTWATGAASVQQGAGTVLALKLADAGPNGGPVYRLEVTATGTAGNTRSVFVYPSGTSQNTQTVIVHHVQYEVGAVATSPIVTTTAAVTRAADRLSHPLAGLRSCAVYARGEERGNVVLSGFPRLWQWGGGVAGNVRVVCDAGTYGITLSPTSGAPVGRKLTTAPAVGQGFEILAQIELADGAVRGRIHQSIDGGPIESTAWSAPVPADFSPATLYVGARDGGNDAGLLAVRDLLILRGAGWTMDQVRAYLPGW